MAERHSLRGSVDWNQREQLQVLQYLVTPYAGVWIEIIWRNKNIRNRLSLPTRECGLKYYSASQRNAIKASLPTRECGLKLVTETQQTQKTPSLPTRECGLKFPKSIHHYLSSVSLPTRECGLKSNSKTIYLIGFRHSLRGSVDWNFRNPYIIIYHRCHSLRGSVDWNQIPKPFI